MRGHGGLGLPKADSTCPTRNHHWTIGEKRRCWHTLMQASTGKRIRHGRPSQPLPLEPCLRPHRLLPLRRNRSTPPTYVDDLAALTHGAEHTMRVEVCLVVAGKLAGLHTDNHSCSW
eukprot:1158193-Heterocapsa_arctica.AAC.1